MAKILVAMEDSIQVMEENNGGWTSHDINFGPKDLRCLALAPFHPECIYCGTGSDGLWRSVDGGFTWEPVGAGITHKRVLAVAASPTERNVVWAGTEPSALFRSADGGATWVERTSLQDIPSKSSWRMPVPVIGSFIHHVRWIQPDPLDENTLYVAIEMGGIMKSTDKGLSWQDHHPAAEVDAHSLTMHQKVPGRLYEAGGGGLPKLQLEFRLDWPPVRLEDAHAEGGYAESKDGGQSWTSDERGMGDKLYLWSIAVDADNPDLLIASAARGAIQGHVGHVVGGVSESFILRREGDNEWETVTTGLPDPKGTIVAVVAAHPETAGMFYAASNKGVFRSVNGGRSWQQIRVAWPERFQEQQTQGIVIAA